MNIDNRNDRVSLPVAKVSRYSSRERGNPESGEEHRRRFVEQQQSEVVEEGIRLCYIATEAEGASANTFIDLGLALAKVRRFDEANDAFVKALAFDPKHFDALMNAGIVLQELGRRKEAVEFLLRAADVRPEDASCQNNLGVAFAEQGKFTEAIEYYERLLARAPDYVLAWNNLGNALRSLGRTDEALAALQKALAIKPDYAEAHNNVGIVYAQREQVDEAIASYDRALLLRPDYSEAHANRGLVHLLRGDFQRGWSDYEWRWQGPRGLKRRAYGSSKLWDGSPLPGKRLLLYYEQGLGDTFQFIRYARELKGRGAVVVLECQGNTRQILSRTPGIDEFVIRGEPAPKVDFHAPLLSLPGLCQTNLDNLPRRVPYISGDPSMTWEWKRRLAAHPGFRVGIVWQGNPEHKGDRNRSIPLEKFAPLATVPGVTLISLQRNFGGEQLAALNGKFPVVDLTGMAEEADGWLRTAALLANLDLVIGIDTSVLHLAGAMGVPVWMALPTSPDWRWMLSREDTPWYPTMRLFRQSTAGDWDGLISQIAEALREHVAVPVTERMGGVVENGESLVRRATKHLELGELKEAEALLWQAIALDPTLAPAHQDLGVACARQGRISQAIACFHRALELSPDSPGGHANLGLALHHSGDAAGAVTYLRKAIWLGAGSADAYKNLGRALMAVPDPVTAEQAFWSALRLQPDDADAHYLLSTSLLAQGQFAAGWLEFEWRLKAKPPSTPEPRRASERWIGQPLAGKRVVVIADGDPREAVQFARYVDVLAERGANVRVVCDDAIASVVAGCRGVRGVILPSALHPPGDYEVRLLSIPAVLGPEGSKIPAERPYVGAAHAAAAKWSSRVGVGGHPRICLALDSDGDHEGRANSFGDWLAARLTRELAQHPIEWTELRRTGASNGGSYCLRASSPDIASEAGARPVSDEVVGLVDLAAIAATQDLIIAVDNIVAHLGGAIGRSTWTLLPIATHHRWMVGRDDTPWYPTMRLFRQHVRGDWGDVGDRIVQAITRQMTLRASGQASAR